MIREIIKFFISIKRQIQFLVVVRHWIYHKNFWGRGVFLQLIRYLIHFICGCDFSNKARIPPSTRFPHPLGIVIGDGVEFGENVTVFQNVTFGSHGRKRVMQGYPKVEKDVIVYAGAVIIGDITLGRGCVIGANAVVLESVPEERVAVGNPARYR